MAGGNFPIEQFVGCILHDPCGPAVVRVFCIAVILAFEQFPRALQFLVHREGDIHDLGGDGDTVQRRGGDAHRHEQVAHDIEVAAREQLVGVDLARELGRRLACCDLRAGGVQPGEPFGRGQVVRPVGLVVGLHEAVVDRVVHRQIHCRDGIVEHDVAVEGNLLVRSGGVERCCQFLLHADRSALGVDDLHIAVRVDGQRVVDRGELKRNGILRTLAEGEDGCVIPRNLDEFTGVAIREPDRRRGEFVTIRRQHRVVGAVGRVVLGQGSFRDAEERFGALLPLAGFQYGEFVFPIINQYACILFLIDE